MTVTKIAAPGAKTIHGETWSMLRPSLIILPHSAIGGFTPSPRKESPANSIIIVPISKTDVTRMGPAMFGRTCFTRSFGVLLPESCAAIIYGAFFCARVSPLASLANFGQLITASAIIALWTPPPSTPATARANTNPGKARNKSEIRIRTVSTFP